MEEVGPDRRAGVCLGNAVTAHPCLKDGKRSSAPGVPTAATARASATLEEHRPVRHLQVQRQREYDRHARMGKLPQAPSEGAVWSGIRMT